MYLCNMFFLKTQGRTHKSSFGMPSISLNQSNLKIHAADEDQEMGDWITYLQGWHVECVQRPSEENVIFSLSLLTPNR